MPVDSSARILGVEAEPTHVTGPELLQQLLLCNPKYAERLYRSLGEEDKQVLQDSDGKHFEHRHRLWRGYEIVEYRKRTAPDQEFFNPYPGTGLYPWEIVKKKLRYPDPLNLRPDCYDAWIRQVRYRTPDVFDVFCANYGLLHVAFKEAEAAYLDCSDAEFAELEAVAERYRDFASWMLIFPGKYCGFLEFYLENADMKSNRPLYNVSQKWHARNPPTKLLKSYTKQHIEASLDFRVCMVLDFIYYAAQAKGVPPSYSWAQDYRQRVGGLVHLRGGYSNLSIYQPLLY